MLNRYSGSRHRPSQRQIAATTPGETGDDAVTMSTDLDYLSGTITFTALFLITVSSQFSAAKLHPLLLSTPIMASITVDTILADLLDRSIGIGYVGASSVLFVFLVSTLLLRHQSNGSVSVSTIDMCTAGLCCRVSALFAQTLGTELDGWPADGETGPERGYDTGAIVFPVGLAAFRTRFLHAALPSAGLLAFIGGDIIVLPQRAEARHASAV